MRVPWFVSVLLLLPACHQSTDVAYLGKPIPAITFDRLP